MSLARFRAAQAQRDEDRRVYRQLGRARAKRERKRARQVVLPTWRPDKRTNTQAQIRDLDENLAALERELAECA